jgi:hypothetical protein
VEFYGEHPHDILDTENNLSSANLQVCELYLGVLAKIPPVGIQAKDLSLSQSQQHRSENAFPREQSIALILLLKLQLQR